MRKPAVVTKALWGKMKPDQQKRFVELYRTFKWELKNSSNATDEIKAHNLAYLASKP